MNMSITEKYLYANFFRISKVACVSNAGVKCIWNQLDHLLYKGLGAMNALNSHGL